MTALRIGLLLAIASCAGASGPRGARYPVPAEVGLLVVDDSAFAALAARLRADVEADLARPDLAVDARKDRLFMVALLDALDERWPEALAAIDAIAALEARPELKAMTGLTIRVWADARAHGGDSPEAFRAALERKLDAMPVELVRDSLSMLRTMGQVFTPETCRRLVNESIGPEVRAGTVAIEQAEAIAFQRYAVKRLVRVGPVIDEVLGARGIAARSE